MQPYFIPYAGYFRLFAASDLFVAYDCVQFTRRGWVHRNRLPDRSGALHWLTLPLRKAPQDVLIRDLRFATDAPARLAERLLRFDLGETDRASVRDLLATIHRVEGTPSDYIMHILEWVVDYLKLPRNIIRSSSLDLPPSLRGQDRIMEITRRLGAKRYVNAPGGRDHYDPQAFAAAGIELRFLPEYLGPSSSILSRIIGERPDNLAAEIRASAV